MVHKPIMGVRLGVDLRAVDRVPPRRLRMRLRRHDDARKAQAPLPKPTVQHDDQSAQDTWWALEDLWSRLAMHCAVTVERDAESQLFCVVVAGFRDAHDGPVGELRPHVFDDSTYTWYAGRSRGSYVSLIAYRGDDLVFTLVGLRAIEAWPEGSGLVWQVQGFLARLQRRVP